MKHTGYITVLAWEKASIIHVYHLAYKGSSQTLCGKRVAIPTDTDRFDPKEDCFICNEKMEQEA